MAVQGSPTGIAVMNQEGKVLLSNARAHDMSLVYDRTVQPEVWETAQQVFEDQETHVPVSYTHLTLPTICSV